MDPQESVLAQLQETRRAAAGSRLDLRGHSLSVDTCAVLGRVLHKDTLFTELALSDCMLTEEGMCLLGGSRVGIFLSFCYCADCVILCIFEPWIYYESCRAFATAAQRLYS